MTPDDLLALRSTVIRYTANLGLAALGLLITHETAYLLATWLHPLIAGDGGHGIDHGHQHLLVAAAGPLSLWVTAWFVIRQVRRLGVVATWGPRRLTATIAGLYLTQESIEILSAGPTGPGPTGLIENRAIVIGLLLAPLVAGVLLRILERAEQLVSLLLSGPQPALVAGGPPHLPTPTKALLSGVAVGPGDPRGPPFETLRPFRSLDS